MKFEVLNALDYERILKELDAPSTKEIAASRLAQLKIPNKKSEKYRYFDIEKLMSKDWDIEPCKYDSFSKEGKSIQIENGSLNIACDIDGVEVEIKEFTDIESEHFDPLYYLSHLLNKKSIIIRVSKDAKFNIEHIFNASDKLITYNIVILLDANVHADIYEKYSGDARDSFVLGGYDIFVSKDATFRYTKSQTLNENLYTPIFTTRYQVDKNATLKLGTFEFAKGDGLNLFRAELEENANIEASHLLYGNGAIKNGVVSEIVHEGKSSNSSQNAKSILDNKARGIFDALIRVQNSAKWTKAHQNSKAILLHSGAYMASKPQLEIYIDDLEASHGSTTGQLDEKQLFYLRSRGIAKSEAKKMLIIAFANEIIDTIEDEYLKNKIHSEFEKAYYGVSDLECIQTCHECEDMILKD